MKIKNSFIYGTLLASVIFSCCFISPLLAQHSEDNSAKVSSFDKYVETITTVKFNMNGDSIRLQNSHDGMCLVELEPGLIIPLITQQGTTTIVMENGKLSTRPDGGNDFLHRMLSKKNDLAGKKMLVDEYAGKNENNRRAQYLVPLMNKAIDSLKQDYANQLKNAGNSHAGIILKALDLKESSSQIKTVEDLLNKRVEFIDFVRVNSDFLSYTQLVELMTWQYLMMHEYVYAGSKGENERILFESIRQWADGLDPAVPARESVQFAIKFFYGRSMVTRAGEIMEQFPEYSWCGANDPKVPTTLTPQLEALPLKDNSNKNIGYLKDVNSPVKIAVVIRDGCIPSNVQQIRLMRNNWITSAIPVITIFTGKRTALTQKAELEACGLFMDATQSVQTILSPDEWENLPTLLVLDEKNNVISTAANVAQLEKILEKWEQKTPE